ncbi:MAG: type II toxin-antitoxin system prevent-host-death family antitoxin [Rubrivivax sp.]|nr:type II toxin-antitoxin system prevent-host-death family antitoxin [Rubrivivax sp.]
MEVTVRELKTHLSAIVRRVQAGETALITSHRKPVARLVPPPPRGDSVTDRLLAAGVIGERPSGAALRRHAPNPLPPGVGSVADAVIEDRG